MDKRNIDKEKLVCFIKGKIKAFDNFPENEIYRNSNKDVYAAQKIVEQLDDLVTLIECSMFDEKVWGDSEETDNIKKVYNDHS